MDLFDIRKDFSLSMLDESAADKSPFNMLQKWISEALQAQVSEPTAMTLSTVGEFGQPSSRVVLLKELRADGLVFFTNYESKKGKQLIQNNKVAINFCWHELERQVRIEGIVERVADEDSDRYYNLRPEESKIGAWASPQSQVIPDRSYLNTLLTKYKDYFENKPIVRPENWGGYLVVPHLFEFWQGRKNRLHDRLQYRLGENGKWIMERLAP